jgi:formylglycine-generating enzyme required for sulfatase activity
MNGAADTNQNGSVNLGELFEYVREHVQRDTEHRQHPLIGANPFDRNLTIAIPNPSREQSVEIVAPTELAQPRDVVVPGDIPAIEPAGSQTQADLILEIGNVAIELRWIPAGQFRMGSDKTERNHIDCEAPIHLVRLPAFYISSTPITQAQWRAVANLPKVSEALDPAPARFVDDRHPVEQVSWFEAMEFCRRLAKLSDRAVRLPSEAEWEYACRAGGNTVFTGGDYLPTTAANYDWRKAEVDALNPVPDPTWLRQTSSVQQFPANNFGLYDLHGNVAEWCLDGWHSSYRNAPEDGGVWTAEDDSGRVVRGGSWSSPPKQCRCAYRTSRFPGLRDATIGFRIVCAG